MDAENKNRIGEITLDERLVKWRSPDIEHERRVAIFDLLEENSFAPTKVEGGPWKLHLSLSDNRLIFDITCQQGDGQYRLSLPTSPLKRIIRDYFQICESYFEAIKNASPSKIEAIDMGRRGIHNEGSETLRDLISEEVEVDFDTARRLFTLVCVLHLRG